jgi:hypothetical protein
VSLSEQNFGLRIISHVLVAHTGNPSYSRGRDKDYGSKSAQANSSRDPILKKTYYKKGLVE